MITRNTIIDSNLLIDYYTLPLENNKLKKIQNYIDQGVAINDPTISEVTNILKNKYNYHRSFLALNGFLHYPHYSILPIQTSARALAFDITKKYRDLELAYNDCLLLAQSNIYGLPILTDDEAMWGVKEASFSYLS